MNREEQVKALEALSKEIHGVAVSKGFWDTGEEDFRKELSNVLHEFDFDENIPQQDTISKIVELSKRYKERSEVEAVALMHSELSEGVEAMREGNPPDKHLPQFDSVSVELADTIVRILDLNEGKNLNVIPALFAKLDFNKTRERLHGKKF